MPRWITITKAPFDYRFPESGAIMHFSSLAKDTEQFVKDEIADYAIAKGFASEGKLEGSTAKSVKGGAKRARRKGATKTVKADKLEPDASASNLQPDSGLDDESLAQDDSAKDGDSIMADAS